MKNILEKIKDILYASIDYLIMLAIIVSVVLIIGWRLDILFQKDVLASTSENPTKIETSEAELQEEDTDIDEASEDDLKDRDEEDGSRDNGVADNEDIENAATIQVEIPAGSLPSEIASILKSMDLIEDNTKFVEKAIALNLDTKLKSGSFSIPENSSLEDIIRIISK